MGRDGMGSAALGLSDAALIAIFAVGALAVAIGAVIWMIAVPDRSERLEHSDEGLEPLLHRDEEAVAEITEQLDAETGRTDPPLAGRL